MVKVLFRTIFILAVLGAGASLFFTAEKGVESNLAALLGDAAGGGLKEAATAMGRSAKFIVKARTQDEARNRLEQAGVHLPPSSVEGKLLEVLKPYANGFLSPQTRELLERGDYAAVRDAAVARLFSPLPPVLSPLNDPFLLFTEYVLQSQEPKNGWIVVAADFSPEDALSALNKVKGIDDVRCAGAPFHTAVASEKSRREINALSVVSCVCVMLFGWLLTRSFKFVFILVPAVSAAFCVSSAALFCFFDKPHVIALVFGTTLIGMSVDYVYHAVTAKGDILKPLTMSCLSTLACFLPLLASSVEVLNQMAVFTIAGLITVFAGTIAFRKKKIPVASGGTGQSENPTTGKDANRCFRLAVFGMGVLIFPIGIWLGSTVSRPADISRFHKPDSYLAEGERILAEICGGDNFIPSSGTQKRNIALVRKLFEAEGANYCKMAGLPLKVLQLPECDEVFAPRECIEQALVCWESEARKMLYAAMLTLLTVFAIVRRRHFFDFALPVFLTYGCMECVLVLLGESGNFFARICFFIFMGLGFDYSVFRRHVLTSPGGKRHVDGTMKAVFYSFLTSFTGFGLLAFTDFSITRTMGLVLSAGLAVSYVSVKFSCGISEVLPSVFRDSKSKSSEPESTVWHEQREQCASLFWARFMWYSYAWFGKNFQKVIFVIGMPVIYLFSRPARIALKKFYAVLSEFSGRQLAATTPRLFRHILGFAWGLMDKTDACTLKKNLPVMSVREDEGWHRFVSSMNSGKGVFLMCTHVGMIGVLPALPESLEKYGKAGGLGLRIPKVHAFQQMGHDAVFMKVFMEHFDASKLQLHAVEDIGVETAVKMKEAIERGEIVIMAGDRVSAGSKSVWKHQFMGRECLWPKGVYRFAKLMESPVFAVTCICTGWNRYEVHFAALERDTEAMLDGFVGFLERETISYPNQWFQFYDFFLNPYT